jgi:hypothetical protein
VGGIEKEVGVMTMKEWEKKTERRFDDIMRLAKEIEGHPLDPTTPNIGNFSGGLFKDIRELKQRCNDLFVVFGCFGLDIQESIRDLTRLFREYIKKREGK